MIRLNHKRPTETTNVSRTKLIIHPTCISSYNIVKTLAGRDLLGEINIIVAETPFDVVRYGVWSVPLLVVDEKPVAADPLTPEEVEAVLNHREIPVRNPIEAFKDTVIHSGYLSSIVGLWGSIDPVLTREIVSIAVRAPLTKIDVDKALREISEKKNEVYRELLDVIHRTLAVGFTRELLWASRGELTEETLFKTINPLVVKTWLIAKTSIGRIGLPGKPWEISTGIEELIVEFIEKGARGILNKVKREYETLKNDSEYWEILERIRVRSGAAGI